MGTSKVYRLSGAAQDVLRVATGDLPPGANLSQRVVVLGERMRAAERTAAALASTTGAGGIGSGLSRQDLDAAPQALRYQLLSDFADAG